MYVWLQWRVGWVVVGVLGDVLEERRVGLKDEAGGAVLKEPGARSPGRHVKQQTSLVGYVMYLPLCQLLPVLSAGLGSNLTR